jgi:hypothetical protein
MGRPVRLFLSGETMESSFKCMTCGASHPGPATCYGPEAPAYWYGIPPEDRAARFPIGGDLGVLDGTHYFIRGHLEIPIHGRSEPFVWVVWSTLSRANFDRVVDNWESEGRESEPPYFGYLSTVLPGYPDTMSLKVQVHTRRVGLVPTIELEATDHPLSVEQRGGMPWSRVEELASIVLHESKV